MNTISCQEMLLRLSQIKNHLDNFDLQMNTTRETGDFRNIHKFWATVEMNIRKLKSMYDTFENGSISQKFKLVDKGHEVAASIRRRKKLASGEVIRVGDKFELVKRGGLLRDEVLGTDVFELVGFVEDKYIKSRRQALLKLKNGRVIFVSDNLFGDVYKKI
ncbi:hypothetical protein HON36_03815 [Candidatus Parcubacteria bacterium]|jgi:hypothetical protein|nr:hypothetical protein [Candidatus Parcubacteria bacterium]MBT7228050.1 hypothetical protein [Candidatus Parcubacteria bacterium]